jgi:hypothetical protein
LAQPQPGIPPQSPNNDFQSFLKYKEERLRTAVQIEANRLADLKDARGTIFKYALPASIIDGVAGALATSLGSSVFILFPVVLFVFLIYYLADALDRKKYQERIDIMDRTKKELDIIRREIL